MTAASNDPTMKAGGEDRESLLGLAYLTDGDSPLGAENSREVNRPHPPNPPACDSFDAKAKARFWRKVSPAPADACWIWWGASNKRGYGNVGRNHRTYLAHRVAYEITVGPVPAGMDLDHLCRTTGCVNPAHLEPVTFLVNMRRRYSLEPDERSTHCIASHELTPSNTLVISTTGQRRCRTCVDDRAKGATA